MKLSNKDIKTINKRYTDRLKIHGDSPKTLGWDKGKQDIRFKILTSEITLELPSILDIGCGFGDLNKTLNLKFKQYNYTGIDIVKDLIEIGKGKYNANYINFIYDDFLDHKFSSSYDYAIASGIFNFRIEDGDNYKFIESIIEKALSICNKGIAFDFLSDKVDYKYKHTHHSAPEKILSIAYKYSRNIILKNNYMPFEFSLFIFKDDSFKKETTTFNSYIQKP